LKSKNNILLWLLHEGNMSGANLALLEYFELLKDLNFELKVISPASGTFTAHLKTLQIPVSIVPFYPWTREKGEGFFIKGWLRRLLRNSYACFKIVSLAKNTKAICTNTICTQLGTVAAWLKGKPHFLFVHEFGEEDHGFHLALPTPTAYRMFYKYSQKVVLNSKAVQVKWQQIITENEKFAILYNPVNRKGDVSQFPENLKPLRPRFLMLGQISAAKGHEWAIDAFEALSKRFENVELDIVGSMVSQEYFEGLQRRITNSSARIFLKPPVDNPFELFSDYTALLMCSRQEAFGRVTVEALKYGLPVIGFSSGGTTEIVQDGLNGYLVEPGNKEDLINQMGKMVLMNPEVYSKMVLNAKKTENKFNEEISRQQLQTIFKSLN